MSIWLLAPGSGLRRRLALVSALGWLLLGFRLDFWLGFRVDFGLILVWLDLASAGFGFGLIWLGFGLIWLLAWLALAWLLALVWLGFGLDLA